MSEIKIDKAAWNTFSKQSQDKAVRFLKDNGILDEHDTIVEVEGGAGHALNLLDTVENCIDGCVAVSNAAFVACMQGPGADKRKCFEVRAKAFYACMEDCQND